MKIRQGFVSNSSSSSFTCDICGDVSDGYDLDMEEAGVYECVNGHCFCEDHMNGKIEIDMVAVKKFCLENAGQGYSKEEVLEMKNDELVDFATEWDYLCDDRYSCPAEKCPICSFLNVNVNEAYMFLLHRISLSEEQLLKDIKEQFKDYDTFQKFLKDKKDKN